MTSKHNKFSFAVLPVLAGFFVMGFCDIVGITSDYVQKTFGWSDAMTCGQSHQQMGPQEYCPYQHGCDCCGDGTSDDSL